MIRLNEKLANQTDWRDWAKTLILLAMGIYMVYLIASGNLANYINLRFQWLSYLAAGIFLVMGAWSFWDLYRQRRQDQDEAAALYGDLGWSYQSLLSWPAIMVLAIPLLLGAAVPSEPLGAEAISGSISLNPVGVGAPASYQPDPMQRNILDWLREFSRVSNPAALNGEQLDVVGFIYREPSMGANEFMIARFTMSCCVADAFAIGMPVVVEDAAQYETGVWVRIQGELQAGSFGGETLPIIQPESIEPVETPNTPYLYS